jgi:AraC family transcriptional regulator of adaptative response / DNA-3-methyladenine glycosylase II
MRRCGSACPVRARATSAIAAAVTADPKLLGIGCSLKDAITHLRALPGVGLTRALANEAGIRPNAVELLARAEAWRPWRAYAAQHLWAASPTATEKAA